MQKGVKDFQCFRCGSTDHIASGCKLPRDIECRSCGKMGHLQKVCMKSGYKGKESKNYTSRTKQSRRVCRVEEEEDEDDVVEAPLYKITSVPPIVVQVQIDDCLVQMEVDTGATMSLMSANTLYRLWPGRKVQTTKVRLCSYSKEPIPVVGCCEVNINYKGQSATVPLIVVPGAGPTLLGRNWLAEIRLSWQEIHYVNNNSLQSVLDKYPAVFQNGLGKMEGFKAKIHVQPDAKPKFCRARSVPYAMREKVEAELNCLLEEGTLERVEVSDWASPIVPVIKSDKSLHICGDFRVTVNPASKLDAYPIPKVEDLFTKLQGGTSFTKIDLSNAYQQLVLDEESKKYTVINTHKGLFQYTRLPFGISSALGIFQRVLENVLQNIPGVVNYLDDILISGKSEEEHLLALEEVLKRLANSGLRVKMKKCEFMKPYVDYLGHRIDAEGLHPLPDKVEAIHNAPSPQSVQELKAYLGLLT